MNTKNLLVLLAVVLGLAVAGYSLFEKSFAPKNVGDGIPKQVTLSGNYACLSPKNTTEPKTEECVFGFQADTGEMYAVNFGQSAIAMELFKSRAHVTAEGFVVPVEALNTDQWSTYDIVGIFTIISLPQAAAPNAKINIDEVCKGALAYMTFTDGASAEKFVSECKEGKHPEVIEQYKKQMGLGDGAAI